MNYENTETSDLLEKRAAILAKLDEDGADLDALENEVRAINDELEKRKAKAAKQAEIRKMVNDGAGVVVETIHMEERKMPDIKEIRNSAEYINAYANYIKTGKDAECRALLSTNGTDDSASLTGYVPVPEMVDGIVRTAWEKSGVMNLVKKTYIRGNLKVGFELSATGAVVHQEGTAAPSEEVITLGIVSLIPQSIKKWITISDEALDLAGEAFLRYIYEEITYRIAKAAEAELIGIIAGLDDEATSTAVSAQVVDAAPGLGVIAQAMGQVIGNNLTVVMNRGTWAAFRAAYYNGNFPTDPFEGLNVVYTEALEAYADADAGDVYGIVGDFYEGAQANFPNGDEIGIKVDNLSLAEKDLVKFVGREYVAIAAVADKRFCLLTKPANP